MEAPKESGRGPAQSAQVYGLAGSLGRMGEEAMKLYLIQQDINAGYDTYDSAVVCAESREVAQKMHPRWEDSTDTFDWGDWTNWEDVKVTYIGEAHLNLKAGPVCTSFNAG